MPSNPLTNKPEMAVFLHELRDLILRETAAQRRQIQGQWAKPLPTRVAEGYAVENVRLQKIRPNGQIELTCTRNQSRFRPGDILNLNRNNPFFQPNFTVNLDEDDETLLVVSTEAPLEIDRLFQEKEGWILDIGFLDLSGYVIGALAQAGDSLVGRERILPLLMKQTRPGIDPSLYARGLDIGETLELNYDQSQALANGYATDLAHLVQGPPGTGKTRVLATLARALVSDGERVLISAFTHRAINNALNALVKQDPDIAAIKVGQAARADDLRVKSYETFHESPLAGQKGGYIVGATPFAPQTKRLGGVEFDTVIFDEASQITLPLAIMGMLAGQKYIFFGDQKQLPPVLTTRLTGGAFRDSVFSHLAGQGFGDMLTETYRLNDSLTQWPSEHFYGGSLVSVPAAAKRRLVYPTQPTRLTNILAPDEPKVFWDLGHHNNTIYSYKEAYAVVDLITALLECGFPAEEIGVVAPYWAQGRLIRNLLRKYVPEKAIRRHIITDTVERMQGQERDLIILSLTTSNPGFAAAIGDFFFQPERLNVAITRPRKKLIIVGSRHVLKAPTANPDLQATIDLLANLLESCVHMTEPPANEAHVWESDW